MFKNLILIGIACLCAQKVFSRRFEAQCLYAHNKYRKMHRVPDLVLDSTLTKTAKEWAIHISKNGKLENRPNNKYGENLYVTSYLKVTGVQVVKTWHNEIKDYNYDNPGFSMKTAHFTQVVWKSSKKVGCARSNNGTKVYAVCNYDPPGNVHGLFEENVLWRYK